MNSVLRNRRVLVVDDYEPLRRAIVREFQQQGCETAEASGGFEALRLIKERSYDVVLTDLRMAEGDGIALLAGISASGDDAPPVIMMSAFCDLSETESRFAGAETLISKPFEKRALVAAVERVLMTRIWGKSA
jgi:CheY-like chemotaxis protein